MKNSKFKKCHAELARLAAKRVSASLPAGRQVLWRSRTKFGMTYLVIFLTFSFLLFTLNLTSVRAQQVSLSIDPPISQIVIQPGQSLTTTYKLENLADPTLLTMKILPFTPVGMYGNIAIAPQFEGPIRFTSENPDMDFTKEFFVKPKETKNFNLHIRIPDGSPEGDYYYSLLAQSQPPPGPEGVSSSQIKVSVGTNILITVTKLGNVDLKAKIAHFDINDDKKLNIFGKKFSVIDTGSQIPLTLIVENTGRNIINPSGKFILKGNFGERAQYDIIPRYILSQSKRLMSESKQSQVTCKSAECSDVSSINLSGFFIGQYVLSTSISLSDSGPVIYSSTSFIAFPFKFLIILLLIILIVTIYLKKRRVKHEMILPEAKSNVRKLS